MLNNTGVTTITAHTPKGILWAPDMAVALSVVVNNTGVEADSAGKKIIKAGTPVTGDLTARQTAFTKAATALTQIGAVDGASTPVKVNKSNAVGVLLHDMDVTAGKANGTIVVAGVVDLAKVDTTTAALVTAEVKAACSNIIFVK